MSDFNLEDLQQLLKVSSSGEFVYYSLEKIKGYKCYIDSVGGFEGLNTNIKEFIGVLQEALSREEASCLEKKALLENYSNDYMFPNIFSLDINKDTDSLETLVTKFSEKFEFYVVISNIINDSYNVLEGKDQGLQQGYKITDDSSLVNKLNDATTKAYETPVEKPNISMTVVSNSLEPAATEVVEKPPESKTVEVEKLSESETVEVEKPLEPVVEKPSEPVVENSPEPVVENSPEPATGEEVEKPPEPATGEEVEKPPESNAVENEKNNSDEIIEMSDLENLADNASETLSSMADMIRETTTRMQDACEKLNTKKQEVQVCKASLEEFKAKGMNVDSALIPLNEQHDSIHNELNVLLNSYKTACIALGELAKE